MCNIYRYIHKNKENTVSLPQQLQGSPRSHHLLTHICTEGFDILASFSNHSAGVLRRDQREFLPYKNTLNTQQGVVGMYVLCALREGERGREREREMEREGEREIEREGERERGSERERGGGGATAGPEPCVYYTLL